MNRGWGVKITCKCETHKWVHGEVNITYEDIIYINKTFDFPQKKKYLSGVLVTVILHVKTMKVFMRIC